MEELRSTEILDKEIEAEARKKAEKILAKADAECAKILEDASSRIEEAQAQKEKFYEAKLRQFEKNVNAAIPLEKERFLVKFYADSVSSALNDYLRDLGAEKRLSLVEKSLEKKSALVSGKRFSGLVFGFSLDSAKRMLERRNVDLSSVDSVDFERSGEEAAGGNEIHEGIVLESEDGSLRIRLTLDQIVREIEDEHSMELATALFGGKLPE